MAEALPPPRAEIVRDAASWNQCLQGYKTELTLKTIGLIVLTLINLAGLIYAGYILQPLIPKAWEKAQFVGWIAGGILAVIICKRALGKDDSLPNGINEKNWSIYTPLLLVATGISLIALAPAAFVRSQTNLTNYANGTKAAATAHKLRTKSFQYIAHTDGKNYKILTRLGYIQERNGDEIFRLQDFTIAPDAVGNIVLTPVVGDGLLVKDWLKKALSTLKKLERQLDQTKQLAEGAEDAPEVAVKINALENAITNLNGLWAEQARYICPAYTGGNVGKPPNLFERAFFSSGVAEPAKKMVGEIDPEAEGGGDDGDGDDAGAGHIHVPAAHG